MKLNATDDARPLTHAGGWPVVLFSPGFGVERELYAGLVEDLVSHGYVVVAIDHPHDASVVEFLDGHVVLANPQMDITEALSVRVADTRFVLTELARIGRAGFFTGSLDPGHVGMFGHTLGGAAGASAGEGIKALIGNVDGRTTLAAERTYLLAFFDRFVRRKLASLLTRTPGPFAGVRLTVGQRAR